MNQIACQFKARPSFEIKKRCITPKIADVQVRSLEERREDWFRRIMLVHGWYNPDRPRCFERFEDWEKAIDLAFSSPKDEPQDGPDAVSGCEDREAEDAGCEGADHFIAKLGDSRDLTKREPQDASDGA